MYAIQFMKESMFMNKYFTVDELRKMAQLTGALLMTVILSGCGGSQVIDVMQETAATENEVIEVTTVSENTKVVETKIVSKVDSNEVVDEELQIQENNIHEQEPLQYIYNISHDHTFFETFGVEEFYSLQQTYQVRINHDVDSSTDMTAKNDKIEVYTGNVGDGDSGIVLVYSGDGANEPYSIEAHTARAGWTNIYLISKEDKDYLLELQLDIRGGFGELRYVVYAFGEQAGPNLAVWVEDGMSYTYENETFDEAMFMEWADNMEKWLEQAELLLSTQDGEVRVESANDMERYCAEKLLEMILQSNEG